MAGMVLEGNTFKMLSFATLLEYHVSIEWESSDTNLVNKCQHLTEQLTLNIVITELQ